MMCRRCLIAAGQREHKLARSLTLVMRHLLIDSVKSLKLSHTDCTSKGDSEGNVKRYSALIQWIYSLARSDMLDLLLLKDF